MDSKHDILFIVRHYRHGSFDTSKALKRLGFRNARTWSSTRIAATLALAIVVSATAAVFIYRNMTPSQVQPEATTIQDTPVTAKSMVIDFEDTSLPEVIDRIEQVYGVEVKDIPENAADYRLSIHYEGTAGDLIETINDILNTNLSLAE